jgi:hypothetical protein
MGVSRGGALMGSRLTESGVHVRNGTLHAPSVQSRGPPHMPLEVEWVSSRTTAAAEGRKEARDATTFDRGERYP